MDKFEQASRQKLTFSTTIGTLRTDDLWSIPLQSSSKISLDAMAQAVDKVLKEATTASFVSGVVKDPINELRLEILKHIISVKITEKATAEQAAVTSSKRKELLSALNDKEKEQYRAMSTKDIKKELAKLA